MTLRRLSGNSWADLQASEHQCNKRPARVRLYAASRVATPIRLLLKAKEFRGISSIKFEAEIPRKEPHGGKNSPVPSRI
jgi:hypothetical protein